MNTNGIHPAADNAVILRNYEGMLFRYSPEDRESGPQSHYPSLGVSGLLGGQQSKLMPEGNLRMARRQQNAAQSPKSEANGNGHGAAIGNGHGPVYGGGNGHANGKDQVDEAQLVEPLLPVLNPV